MKEQSFAEGIDFSDMFCIDEGIECGECCNCAKNNYGWFRFDEYGCGHCKARADLSEER